MAFPFVISPFRGRTGTVATTVLAVAALYFGKPFLAPLALAALFAFLLAPLATFLERRARLPVPAAAVASVLALTVVLAGILAVLAAQALGLLQRLPEFQDNLAGKLQAVKGLGSDLAEMEREMEAMGEKLEDAADGETGEPPPEPEPPEVKIAPPKPTILVRVQNLLGPLVQPIVTAAMVFILTLFFLVGRRELASRLVSVATTGDAADTRHAVDEATGRVTRYLLTTLAVNATYGIPIGIGLAIIGLPNAFLWGLLAMLVRFIPYVGPWVGALLPITHALAYFESWTPVLMVVGLYVVIELLSNNLVEPWLYGRRTGLSPQAIVVAAFFWTWLWGGVGLFLAVPLTLCLAVAGRYAPELSFLHVLLSDDRIGIDTNRFLGHLVGGNRRDAEAIARRHVEESGFVAFYDGLAAPAQGMAEASMRRGSLTPAELGTLRGTLVEVLDGLEEEGAAPERELTPTARPVVLIQADAPSRVAALACRRALDNRGHAVQVVEAMEREADAVDLDRLAPEDAGIDVVLVAPPPRLGDPVTGLITWLCDDPRVKRLVAYAWTGGLPGDAMLRRVEETGARITRNLAATLEALATDEDDTCGDGEDAPLQS